MSETGARSRIVVVGAGPAGLMAAEVLATAGADVTVHDRMPSPGRKFLLAGRGGLNLTHSEPPAVLLDRYGPDRPQLRSAVGRFDAAALRAWSEGLGQPTFVGTSGRVFPEAFRATPLLRAWLRRLDDLGVRFVGGHRWTGWVGEPTGTPATGIPATTVRFTTDGGATVDVTTDAVVLALGGASWPRTGSDGAWVGPVADAGIDVVQLRPANCGFEVSWSPEFARRFAGSPLKNIRAGHRGGSSRGDAMITAAGIEGGPVYALARTLRDAIDRDGAAVLTLDLCPDLSIAAVAQRIARRRPKDSTSTVLRRAVGLHPAAAALVRETGPEPMATDDLELARAVKAVPVTLDAPRPIDRAISTAGGIAWPEIDERFMLRRRPGTFVAGEMIDWEAPTGGYLLQGAFSTAVAAAEGALAWATAPAT